MTNITVLFEEETLLLKSAFAKKAARCNSPESKLLSKYVKLYPNYSITVHKLSTNKAQEHYRGLTYDYMRHYINTHEPAETRIAVLNEFSDKLDIAKCHSKCHRYPKIKTWFLNKYPEIKDFGIQEIVEEPAAENSLALFSSNSVNESVCA